MLRELNDLVARCDLRVHGIRGRRLSTSVGPIHTYRGPGRGDLPPIVLLHGLASCGADFAGTIRHLAPHTREIIAVDAPGHGYSPAPTELTVGVYQQGVLEALDQMVDRPAILVGSSLGGGAALGYGILRPERVAALVLMSPAGAPMPVDEALKFLALCRVTRRRDASAFLGRVYHRLPWYAPVMAHELRRVFHRPQVRQLLASAGASLPISPAQAASLKPPTLLIWGRRDKLLPLSQLTWLRRHLPAQTVISEPETYGHAPYLEYPREVAQDVVDFARAVVASDRHHSSVAAGRAADHTAAA